MFFIIRAEATPLAGALVGEFGDKFRTERERRGFTLDDVSNVTKISPRMLKAIEDEHFDQLPGGVFNKGFVRAYAKHLGLNDEEAISEYLICLRQAQVDAQTAAWEQSAQNQVSRPVPRRVLGPVPTEVANHSQHPVPGELPRPVRAETPALNAGAADQKLERPLQQKVPERNIDRNMDRNIERNIDRSMAPDADRKQPVTESALRAKKISGFEPASPESARERVTPPPRPPLGEGGHRQPPSGGVSWRIPAVVLAIVILMAVLWNRHSRSASAQGANSTHSTPQSAVAASAPGENAGANSGENARAKDTQTGATTGSAPPAARPAANPAATLSPNSAPTGPSRVPSPSSSTTESASSAAPKPSSSTREDENDVTSRRIPPPGRQPAVKPPLTFTLVIRASENSWISVAADGQTVSQETLIAPAHTSIRATRQIIVKAGNAAGVSFLLNGKVIPATGAEAEVKTYVFDSTGLTPAPPSDPAR